MHYTHFKLSTVQINNNVVTACFNIGNDMCQFGVRYQVLRTKLFPESYRYI
jgi:hypothetical protein